MPVNVFCNSPNIFCKDASRDLDIDLFVAWKQGSNKRNAKALTTPPFPPNKTEKRLFILRFEKLAQTRVLPSPTAILLFFSIYFFYIFPGDNYVENDWNISTCVLKLKFFASIAPRIGDMVGGWATSSNRKAFEFTAWFPADSALSRRKSGARVAHFIIWDTLKVAAITYILDVNIHRWGLT